MNEELEEWAEKEKEKVKDTPAFTVASYHARITEQLALYMEENSYSFKDIASDSTLTVDDIQGFFLYDENFSLEKLAKISKVLGIEWKFVLCEKGYDPAKDRHGDYTKSVWYQYRE